MAGAEPGRRANGRRGEIEAEIGGERRILCLTLGALAELETVFGVSNVADLAGRFSDGRIGARDMIAIIGAGLLIDVIAFGRFSLAESHRIVAITQSIAESCKRNRAGS